MSISIVITTNKLYVAITGALQGAYCKDLGDNWLRYNGTVLYDVLAINLV